MQVDLKGQVALVVGSNGRFGEAIARALAANGARIIRAASQSVDPIGSTHPPDEDGLRRTHGRLDALIVDASTEFSEPIRFERLCRSFADGIPPASTGRIVTIVSATGIVPMRGERTGSMNAAAIISLTRALAMDLAPQRIAVNAVAAGHIDGDSPSRGGEARDMRLLSHVPLGRAGTSADVANATLFLVDPENAYMTGHILAVDGGWLAGYARDF